MASRTSAAAAALYVQNLALIEDLVKATVRRSRCRREDAEEFGSDVKLRLMEEDYAVLRKWEGRSSLRTYLAVVIQRLYLDDRARRWGKWRPSAVARRLGEAAVRVETLIVRDRHSHEEAWEILTRNDGWDFTRSEFEAILERLPPRTRRLPASEEAIHALAVSEQAAEDEVRARERRECLERVIAAVYAALEALPDTDRMIAKMRFEDSRTVADISHALQTPQKPLYRRVDDIALRIQCAVARFGVSREEIAVALDGPGTLTASSLGAALGGNVQDGSV